MGRLSFLILILAVIAYSSLGASPLKVENLLPEDRGIVPMLQTMTGETSTQINILGGRETKWTFEIIPGSPRVEIKEISHEGSFDKVYKLTITKLSPGSRYILSVKSGGRRPHVFDRRYFKTFPKGKKSLQFAFGSCMMDSYEFRAVAESIWERVEDLNPDLILLGGDNVYVDEWGIFGVMGSPSKNTIWQRYADSFKQIPIFKFKQLIPTLSTWDDHDYGKNDGNRTWGEVRNGWNPVAEASKAFHAFFGSMNFDPLDGWHIRGPGVSSRTDVLGHRFIFLDNRTFRSPEDSPRGHLGKEQEDFLLQQISGSSSPIFIVIGGPLFGGYLKKESFEHSHREDFKAFTRKLKDLYVKNPSLQPFAIISGDVHFSEVMEIEAKQFGFKTYELTSSSWHSIIRRVLSDPRFSSLVNPRRLVAIEGHNFLWAGSQPRGDGGLSFQLRAYGVEGEIEEMRGSYLLVR